MQLLINEIKHLANLSDYLTQHIAIEVKIKTNICIQAWYILDNEFDHTHTQMYRMQMDILRAFGVSPKFGRNKDD